MELLGPSMTSWIPLKCKFIIIILQKQTEVIIVIVAAVIQAILTPGGPFLPTGQATLY